MHHSTFFDLFNEEPGLLVHKGLLRHTGPEMTIFLSWLIAEYKGMRMFTEDGAFVLTHMDLMYLTRMSERAIRRCKKEAKELGLLKTKMKGLPAKEYYYLDLEAIWLLSQGRGG